MKIKLALLLAFLHTAALAQNANVNPTPGDVWTYQGATLGAGFTTPSMSPLALPAVNVKDPTYGAKGDVVLFADGQITAGSNVFTSASSTFTAADVGKKIVISGAGPAGVPHVTTITAFVSAHVVNLASNTSTTVPTYTPTRFGPTVTTAQSGAGSYAPGDTSVMSDGSTFTVSTTIVQSAAAGTNGVGCTNGTYTVQGTTGLGPNGAANRFTASVTMAANVPTVNSVTYVGNYGTNPTDITNEPVAGVAGCGTQPKLALKMGVKTAYVSTAIPSTSIVADPLTQSSSSGPGTGLTLTMGASSWTRTGQGYYGTADGAAFAAALSAGIVGTNANAVYVPPGKYCIDQQLELPSAAPVTLTGPGASAATLYACASGLETVLDRSTTFNFGGGARDITVDAFKLANHAVYVRGGFQGVYRNVVAKNALLSEWRCGNGTVQTAENQFSGISGYTENSVFLPSQRPTYNFWVNASPTSGCTDSVVDTKSTFHNATTANIFDDAGGQNSYISPHIYGFPTQSFYASYGIRCNAACLIVSPELDGTNVAQVYLAGSRATLVGGNAQWATDSQGAAVGALIATGVAGATVTNLAAVGPLGVAAANVVSQAGTADTTTVVANNPGANYWTPVLAPIGSATQTGIQLGGPTYGWYRDGSNIYMLYNGGFIEANNTSAKTINVPLILQVTTVGLLGTCGGAQANRIKYVTDATAPTYGAVLVGGGGVGAIAICDGTNWVAH